MNSINENFIDLKGFCGTNANLLKELDTDGDGKLSGKELLVCVRAKLASDEGRNAMPSR